MESWYGISRMCWHCRFWKQRHELYSAWILAEIIEAVRPVRWELHPEDGVLLFRFKAARMASLPTCLLPCRSGPSFVRHSTSRRARVVQEGFSRTTASSSTARSRRRLRRRPCSRSSASSTSGRATGTSEPRSRTTPRSPERSRRARRPRPAGPGGAPRTLRAASRRVARGRRRPPAPPRLRGAGAVSDARPRGRVAAPRRPHDDKRGGHQAGSRTDRRTQDSPGPCSSSGSMARVTSTCT